MFILKESGFQFPRESRVQAFSVHTVREGETFTFSSAYPDSAIFVLSGRLFVYADGLEHTLNSWQSPTDGLILYTKSFTAETHSSPGFWRDRCTFCVFSGTWNKAEIGVFRVSRCDSSILAGTPSPYGKNTCYPSHADDREQVWMIAKGHGIVQSGNASFPVEQGNLVFIPAGELHDFAIVHSYTECIRLSME